MNDPKGILGITVGTTGTVIEGAHVGFGTDRVGTDNEAVGKPNIGNVVRTCASLLTGAALTKLLIISIVHMGRSSSLPYGN